jgi:hypothetical protein
MYIHIHTHIHIYIYIYIYIYITSVTVIKSIFISSNCYYHNGMNNFKVNQYRQCMYYVTFRRIHIAIVAVGKQKVLHACVCLRMCVRECPGIWSHVALLIQNATRMRHTVLSFVACLAPPYLPTLSHKRNDFSKSVTGYKICVLVFFIILSITFLTLRRIQREIVINMKTSSYKLPVVVIIITF